MRGLGKGLAAVVVIAVFVALFPVIMGAIDNVLYEAKLKTTTITASQPSGVQILVPQLVSQQGADRLVVEPGKAVVPAGETINVKIYVYFKHS